jgi:hypothetical protein
MIAELPLTWFELPKWLVEPTVRSCRLFNTTLDFIFYDVPTLRVALAEKDAPMQARGEKSPSRMAVLLTRTSVAAARSVSHLCVRWTIGQTGMGLLPQKPK